MNRAARRNRQGTIRALEEAVHTLRVAPLAILSSYYLGSLPFVLGFLYFFSDMSRSAFAPQHCAVASLGLALLFAWMKSWQSVFCIRLRHHLEGSGTMRWTAAGCLGLAANQSLIQFSGLIVIPVALLLAVPFGWCFAFYQNASATARPENQGLKTNWETAWQQALLWPRQNHLLISVLFLFGGIVFLNLAIALFLLPHILKKFLGVDTIFTLSGINALNTTFWMTAMGLSYLCIDPLVKTVYTLRCYYGEAKQTGADLKTRLGRCDFRTPTLILVLAAMLLPVPASLQAEDGNLGQTHEVPSRIAPHQLDRSIDEVLKQRAFTWRMPRQGRIEEEEPAGPIAAAIAWLNEQLKKGLKTIGGWIKALAEWISELMPEGPGPRRAAGSADQGWLTVLLVVLLLVLVLGVAAFIFTNQRKKHPKPSEADTVEIVEEPDISDENVHADDLPVTGWMRMAHDLVKKGALRLAVRALYLATLSDLADRNLVTIESSSPTGNTAWNCSAGPMKAMTCWRRSPGW